MWRLEYDVDLVDVLSLLDMIGRWICTVPPSCVSLGSRIFGSSFVVLCSLPCGQSGVRDRLEWLVVGVIPAGIVDPF